MTSYRYLHCLFLLFLLSCSVKKEAHPPISDEKFIQFYADYLIVQDENYLGSKDSADAVRRFDSLYQYYHITKAQVDSTRSIYNNDLAKWQFIYEKAIARMDSLQKSYKQR